MSMQGQVKWFDPKKGYGFILGPEGQDVFVHYSQIQGDGFRSLKDGDGVEYELIQAEKGFQAKTVTRLNRAENHHTNGNVALRSTSSGSNPGLGPQRSP